MSRLPAGLFRWAHGAHARIAGARRTVRSALGVGRPLRIVPYRGYGTRSRTLVKARVLEDRGEVEPRQERGWVGGAVASLRRYDTAEIPGAEVRVRWGIARFEGLTDDEGFLELSVAPPVEVEPGWHRVALELVGSESHVPGPASRVEAEVLVVSPRARFGVISDLDDTVIVTGVRSLAKRAWALFLTEAAVRLPFAGVAAFYRALAAGAMEDEDNPIFYVSSSPWNLYDHLDHFLEVHGLPPGPILLRDWGLTRGGFAPDGRHEHKIEKIRAVLDAFPELPFVLIGDSGQHDAEHYLSVVREAPGRVPVVYIRRVPSRPGRAAQLARMALEVAELGSALVVVEDSREAATDAAARGLIAEAALAEID